MHVYVYVCLTSLQYIKMLLTFIRLKLPKLEQEITKKKKNGNKLFKKYDSVKRGNGKLKKEKTTIKKSILTFPLAVT